MRVEEKYADFDLDATSILGWFEQHGEWQGDFELWY